MTKEQWFATMKFHKGLADCVKDMMGYDGDDFTDVICTMVFDDGAWGLVEKDSTIYLHAETTEMAFDTVDQFREWLWNNHSKYNY